MKIVVLDAYTLNPGERRWEELEELGEVVVHDRTAQLDVVRRAKDAEVVLTNKTILDGFILNLLPKLKYIGVLATGYNVVDLDVARQRGIVVTNIPAYSTQSVAQMAIAHLLNITQRVAHYGMECTARFLLLEYTIDRTGRKENRDCWFWKYRSGYCANS